MPKSALTSRERLKRHGQATPASGERRIENLIVIGASAGGHQALVKLLRDLPGDMPAAIVILLHRPLGPSDSLKWLLGQSSHLPIIEVKKHETLRQSVIFIPPPGRSATFSGGRIKTEFNIPHRRGDPITINRVFTSAAQKYGERVLGVILSGLLSDGTEGLRAVHEAGGLTMVQNPLEAEFAQMPTNAMKGLPVTFCLNLADIGPALEMLVRRTSHFETGLAVAVRMLRDRSRLLVRLGKQSWRNPGTREFLKKELASLRRNLQAIDNLVKASLAEHSG